MRINLRISCCKGTKNVPNSQIFLHNSTKIRNFAPIMEWLTTLFAENAIACTILLFSLVIASGMALGKIKIGGISFGVVFVLFVALAVGHLHWNLDPVIVDVLKNLGLIFFIYSVGLQVGPSFFSSFKHGGLKLNALAVLIALLGTGTTIALFYIINALSASQPFCPSTSLPMFVGVLSGAVTSTPSLGAAQEALDQMGMSDPISLGYAVAYPVGVLGTMLVMVLLKVMFKVDIAEQEQRLKAEHNDEQPVMMTLRVTNPQVAGKTMAELSHQLTTPFIISRVMRGEQLLFPDGQTQLMIGDILFCLTQEEHALSFQTTIGETTEFEWKDDDKGLVSRRIVVTRSDINGKKIGDLHLRKAYGVNITRVNRAGVNLLATPNLVLQVGDRVMVVGPLENIKKAEQMLGNTLKKLNEPHIITIFLGIAMGIALGFVPIYLPNLPMPARLGIAGGPLIVAICIGAFGYKFKLISYTTYSANLMLREVGLCLFLCSIGLTAGRQFVDTVFSAEGLVFLLSGCLITILPPLVVGCVLMAKKENYLTVVGLVAGAHTNAPPLAYASSLSDSDQPAVVYSTVYPLIVFLRILLAQVLILALV